MTRSGSDTRNVFQIYTGDSAGSPNYYFNGAVYNFNGAAGHYMSDVSDLSSVSFAETGDLNVGVMSLHNAYLNFSVTTESAGPVAAVPEPETYAMLLAGLGVLGFVARRRRRKELTVA